ncbi:MULTISPECIES: M48 family metallopeptidase [Streptomycetaceae]|uniref:Ste24 endopeptidase n=1 Tax=Streptantibioticus cattleyicolor (strain ATCC 35852 / DSM 46488 / JCM 4925 / NBRC 14057 / NRRL 8057) TaxID=1003195 RepID=F8K0W7_STREN|nr:M48 family metallopeptidase [Streptantibioticus cattleyicolor]AEW93635.1 Ste24 endopeptidase [Streptantibioticus cattleyicolor NRRL 8057 = DSM 46488]MYS58336.1 M48 family metalloprotease [Streptomyces sp. SID5468]CCB73982.1 Ste24 endopeptidase [Streptantibioticus cattleyicolor NRRL 8057 = DSM 46488]
MTEADFTAEEIARGRALRRAQWPPLLAGRALALALPLLLGLTPAGAALVTAVAEPSGGAWWARVLLGGLALVLADTCVRLPFTARLQVVRARFGLVTQGWAGWWADQGRGLLVGAPLAVGALFALYGLAGATRWWWAWAAGAAAALTVALSWLAPVVLEPLFNRFTPMADGPLRETLLALAARAGVPVRDVLVADASRRTNAVNAYVSGFGATRRIVVHDTLLTAAAGKEVELVTAHELGHVRHRDVARGTLLGAVGAAAGVCLAALALRWPPLLHLAGVERFADPRSMALLTALLAVGSALAGPAGCALSRRVERRADRYALELTGDVPAFIAMQRRLALANVADPDPPRVPHLVFGTHPTTAQRIAAARAHAAAHRTGRPDQIA